MLSKIKFLTAGESHGKALIGIIQGIPAGLEISADYINAELSRRQQGYGRSNRMNIENDKAIILSGIRHGKTIGSPISIMIENKDYENWKTKMSVDLPVSDVTRSVTFYFCPDTNSTGSHFDSSSNPGEQSSKKILVQASVFLL